MSCTLPLRLRILHYLDQNQGHCLTHQEIYEALKDEYEGEGQLSQEKMKWHLLCIKSVGLIEAIDPFWDENQEPCFRYRVTEAGHRNLSYLR